MRHDVTIPLYVEIDEIYNLACPAAPIHYQHDPVQTTMTCPRPDRLWRGVGPGPSTPPRNHLVRPQPRTPPQAKNPRISLTNHQDGMRTSRAKGMASTIRAAQEHPKVRAV
jgi:hypothetical protein